MSDPSMEGEIINLIGEELSRYRCCHGKWNNDTPPMFYPEAIRCIVNSARDDGINKERLKHCSPTTTKRDVMLEFRTTIARDVLLAKLRENRDRHQKMYREAIDGFLKYAKEQFETKLELISRGVIKDVSVILYPPHDFTPDYELAIQMVDMHQGSTIELSSEEFRKLVLDEWEWAGAWLTSNSRWSSTASSYSLSKQHLLH